MAKFASFHNFRLDFLNPDGMISIDDTVVDIPPVTPTRIPIELNNGGLFSIEGTDFSVSFAEEGNEWAAGTVDTIRYSENGTTLFEWSNLNMNLNEIMRLVAFENGIDPVTVEERMVSGDDVFITSGGDDVLYGGTGSDYFDGGAGFDTVLYRESRSGRDVSINLDGSVVISSASETEQLVHIERIQFNDGTLALDAHGNAGQAYRLYQAAFERTPDTDGLGYWIDRLDSGTTALNAIADSFLNSPEFVRTYGTEETVSNEAFVKLLYLHTLGRDYDQNGFQYWVDKLETNQTNRGDLLAFFSESDENKLQVSAAIDDGIWFT